MGSRTICTWKTCRKVRIWAKFFVGAIKIAKNVKNHKILESPKKMPHPQTSTFQPVIKSISKLPNPNVIIQMSMYVLKKVVPKFPPLNKLHLNQKKNLCLTRSKSR